MNSRTKKILIVGVMVAALLLVNPGVSSAASFIKNEEVGSPNGQPYLTAIPDTNGYWQIGFGSTWNYDKNRWVQHGDTITAEQANRYLQNEIREKEQVINNSVTVPINKNQKTALLSFAYNVGTTAFTGSTLLRLLNAGQPKTTVADQFGKWIYADGVIVPGLVNRRARERALFLS